MYDWVVWTEEIEVCDEVGERGDGGLEGVATEVWVSVLGRVLLRGADCGLEEAEVR